MEFCKWLLPRLISPSHKFVILKASWIILPLRVLVTALFPRRLLQYIGVCVCVFQIYYLNKCFYLTIKSKN
jgi:hypothetical protein